MVSYTAIRPPCGLQSDYYSSFDVRRLRKASSRHSYSLCTLAWCLLVILVLMWRLGCTLAPTTAGWSNENVPTWDHTRKGTGRELLRLRAEPLTPTGERIHARGHALWQRGIRQSWPLFRAMITSLRATADERLARSPLTKANRVQTPAGSPNFRKWESYRTMPLVGGFFFRASPVSPAPSFRRRSILTSITLIGSQALAGKSLLNLFTRSLAMFFISRKRNSSRGGCGGSSGFIWTTAAANVIHLGGREEVGGNGERLPRLVPTPGVIRTLSQAAMNLANKSSTDALGFSYTKSLTNPHSQESNEARSGDRVGHATGPPRHMQRSGYSASTWLLTILVKWGGTSSFCIYIRYLMASGTSSSRAGNMNCRKCQYWKPFKWVGSNLSFTFVAVFAAYYKGFPLYSIRLLHKKVGFERFSVDLIHLASKTCPFLLQTCSFPSISTRFSIHQYHFLSLLHTPIPFPLASPYTNTISVIPELVFDATYITGTTFTFSLSRLAFNSLHGEQLLLRPVSEQGGAVIKLRTHIREDMGSNPGPAILIPILHDLPNLPEVYRAPHIWDDGYNSPAIGSEEGMGRGIRRTSRYLARSIHTILGEPCTSEASCSLGEETAQVMKVRKKINIGFYITRECTSANNYGTSDRFYGPKAGTLSILPHCNCTRMSKAMHRNFSSSVLRAIPVLNVVLSILPVFSVKPVLLANQ
ncbi:hypothetical protein PR048_006635 [Dryococelus australis]|uniref:Uncharacterized protein n=1 Tax=Dryococelus australis TaxID=614101 RepID=A0ABQ9ICU8_9NEOP|nr:hypothetical protein PR048_006635 [Dryococelus australis]